MASQVICSSPRAIDPAPQKRLTLDMLKRALAVLKQRNEVAKRPTVADIMADLTTPPAEGGQGAADEPPFPLSLSLIDPEAIERFDDRLDAFRYAMVSRTPSVVELIEAPANPIAYDPSGKDWDGIKAAAARGDYVAPPVHIPTRSSAAQERAVPPLHGALTTWTDKTSRPSLWGRGD